jgi:hypothetical protein
MDSFSHYALILANFVGFVNREPVIVGFKTLFMPKNRKTKDSQTADCPLSGFKPL